jgi:transaldolase/glucose-6-phosphate isomerase
MHRNSLLELNAAGQSVWLDNLTRGAILGGGLDRLVSEDGLSGVTSNPTIFKNAMTSSADYDEQIQELAASGKSAGEIYEALAITDIRGAADILRPVYDRTQGTDGFVSLEVSPHLANDTQRTIDEAARLWKAVARPNIFIKIPGTQPGVPAIEACLARGININITLLFGIDAHRQVIEAYWRAMETRLAAGQPLEQVASVASYFLSRIDVKVDKKLDEMAAGGENAAEAKALRARTAVANAKLAYAMWKEMHAAERWQKLARAGARVQKTLWASTSTKDPSLSDVKYVEALIGSHTINTLPDETIAAFRDHGRVAATLEQGLADERAVIDRLRKLGIDIDRVTAELVDEGIDKFVKPFDELQAALAAKRQAALANKTPAHRS